MKNEWELQQESAVLCGKEAQTILNSNAWQTAKVSIKGDIIAKLENQEILNNNEQLVELVRELQSFNKISDRFEQIVSEGQFAEHELKLREDF